eukprot:1342359-Pleurochrysis_carterae.AAC.1
MAAAELSPILSYAGGSVAKLASEAGRLVPAPALLLRKKERPLSIEPLEAKELARSESTRIVFSLRRDRPEESSRLRKSSSQRGAKLTVWRRTNS